jgi:hypothetical protein
VASKARITGEVEATSGSIGGFEISSNRIGVENSNSYDGLSLYDSFIKFSEAGVWSGIGTNILPASSGLTALARFENTKENTWGENYGVIVKVENGRKNHALSLRGDILGFAVATKQIEENYTVTADDCIISCYNHSDITVTLPSLTGVQVGKIYTIKALNDHFVTIKSSSKIYGTSEVDSVAISRDGGNYLGLWGYCTLVNDGKYWVVVGR